MTGAQAVLLGTIQGLTEFLPVSSSAHLALAPRFFRFPDPGLTVDVALHLGTLLAVLVYYRETWLGLLRGAARDARGPEARTLGLLALATLPAVAAGLALEKAAEEAFRDPRRIGACLIAFSGVMLWADRRGADAPGRPWRESGARTVLLVGCAQALALMPGVSRSGATMSAALLLGIGRAQAAELSFLMSTPIVAGAAALKLRHLGAGDLTGPFFLGLGASAAVGFAAVGAFIRYLPKGGLKPYAAYRSVVGFAALLLPR
ncbi:MAG: undecaprenyl-diphosphate phosphatase [Elusimicrobiota bacterium]|nr:MAG: undecaprenyl-diphosphate phosphatase [Elusimicrobiota bacterium]